MKIERQITTNEKVALYQLIERDRQKGQEREIKKLKKEREKDIYHEICNEMKWKDRSRQMRKQHCTN